jgi:hypothetical protein
MAASSAATALSAEAARMGALLADLLDGLPETQQQALGNSMAFLRQQAALHANAPTAFQDEQHPLTRLERAFGLGALERALLVVAGLPDEHEGYAAVLRCLHPSGLPRPTVGLAAQLLCTDESERHELRTTLVSGALVTSGLLRVIDDGPLPERTLQLPGSLWMELAGSHIVLPYAAADAAPVTAGLEDWLDSAAVSRAVAAIAANERCTVLVVDEDARTAVARGVVLVAAAGRGSSAGGLPLGEQAPDAAALLALHALTRGDVPVLALSARDGGEPGGSPVQILPAHPGPLVLCARPGDAVGHAGRTLLVLRTEPIAIDARRRMWARLLPELEEHSGDLAARLALEPMVAARVASDVRARAWLDRRAPVAADVAAAARGRSLGALPAGVTLRRPVADWSTLVLQPDRVAQLHAAVARLRHQATVLDEWGFLRRRPGARGVRMLLSGPPGTGKSLSAEVLASALGVDLMVVDISRVLSKWIGETEQRLAEVFDAAEPAQAVLLFDEADALFGKRTEVSDAHDRYANQETAYLLQRLERFEGLAILTTNLRQNIDEAFTRRLEFVVEFDEPQRDQREALWRAHVPDGAPLAGDLDFAELAAHYTVVGGLIRNAAVAAAFSAAADGGAITREHALLALQREYEKHGRAFPGRPPDPNPCASMTEEEQWRCQRQQQH